ncbi:MAG: hypothetical protein MZW92_04625 [Comamonadaceae bacterium]|nr:hypothetical protein [Comamonadaceae bacterium]
MTRSILIVADAGLCRDQRAVAQRRLGGRREPARWARSMRSSPWLGAGCARCPTSGCRARWRLAAAGRAGHRRHHAEVRLGPGCAGLAVLGLMVCVLLRCRGLARRQRRWPLVAALSVLGIAWTAAAAGRAGPPADAGIPARRAPDRHCCRPGCGRADLAGGRALHARRAGPRAALPPPAGAGRRRLLGDRRRVTAWWPPPATTAKPTCWRRPPAWARVPWELPQLRLRRRRRWTRCSADLELARAVPRPAGALACSDDGSARSYLRQRRAALRRARRLQRLLGRGARHHRRSTPRAPRWPPPRRATRSCSRASRRRWCCTAAAACIDANPAALAHVRPPETWPTMIGRDLLGSYESGDSRERARRRVEQLQDAAAGHARCPSPTSGCARARRRIAGARHRRARRRRGRPGAAGDLRRRHRAPGRRGGACAARRRMLSHLVATSPDLITLTDLATGRYAMVNHTFERVTGWTRGRGRRAAPPPSWACGPAPRTASASSRRCASRARCADLPHALRRQATARAISMLVSAARFAMDRRDYLVINARDVTDTERERLEREAILANASIGIAVTRDAPLRARQPGTSSRCSAGRRAA